MGPKVLARNWLLYGLFALAGLFVGPLACPCSPERVIVAPAVECPEPEPCQPCPPPYCGPHERRTHRELVRGVECWCDSEGCVCHVESPPDIVLDSRNDT